MAVHAAHDGVGPPRVTAELRKTGIRVTTNTSGA
jgi:hypothetical protein